MNQSALSIKISSRGFIILLLCFTFGVGSSIQFGSVIIRLTDVLIIFGVLIVLGHLYRPSLLNIPRSKAFGLNVCFLLAMILLPIAGVIIHNYSVSTIIGEFRWLYPVIVVFVISTGYWSTHTLIKDLAISAGLFIVLNWLLLTLQIVTAYGISDMSLIINQLFVDTQTYGEYGHRSGRFTGWASGPSGLGTAGVVGFAIFGSVLFGKKSIGLLYKISPVFILLSLLLLIASGHRTSIVSAGALSLVYFMSYILINDRLEHHVYNNYPTYLITFVGAGIVYYLDIGRVRQGRYTTFIQPDLLYREFDVRFDRWTTAIDASNEYSPYVLANPQQVLDVSAIDSGYILLYVQGGPATLGLFIVSLLSAVAIFIKLQASHRTLSVLGLSLVTILLINSIMQNAITSLWGRILLGVIIGILGLLLLSSRYGRSYNSRHKITALMTEKT